jgi:tRNA pseudouridine65 synthase
VRRELAVLHRDASVLAVNKPSGLAVHRGLDRAEDNVVARLAALGLAGVAPVHRLDRPTSGVLLCAMTPDVASALGRAFSEGRVRKSYVALVRGVAPEHELVDHPVPKDEAGPRVPARTRVTRLAMVTVGDSPLRERRYSLVRAEPETGRFHQVRRHLKHLGHPVVGDSTYGRAEHNRLFADRFGLERLALHAEALTLSHPEHGGEMHLVAPLPPDLGAPLRAAGLTTG